MQLLVVTAEKLVVCLYGFQIIGLGLLAIIGWIFIPEKPMKVVYSTGLLSVYLAYRVLHEWAHLTLILILLASGIGYTAQLNLSTIGSYFKTGKEDEKTVIVVD